MKANLVHTPVAYVWILLLLAGIPLNTWGGTLPSIQYSVNFSVEDLGPGIRRVTVKNPWKGARRDFCYLLIQRGKERSLKAEPLNSRGCTVVRVPVESMIVLSSTYYAFIDALGATNKMIGASMPERSNTPSIKRGYQQGRIKDVGQGLNVNVETVLELMPQVIFTYATGGFRDVHPKLQEAGLKVVVCAEYMERHPLGRAEWIKFFGMFLGKDSLADRIFEEIRKGYLGLSKRAGPPGHGPLVITNVPFAGRWFVPGGDSFMTRFIKDAGARYVFGHIHTTGSIPMDVEVVFQRGRNASYWINTGTWNCLSDVAKADPRLMGFQAVARDNLFNNNRRINKLGGNDYWESGVLHPERILADLITIFHPGALPGHKLFYYKRLEASCK